MPTRRFGCRVALGPRFHRKAGDRFRKFPTERRLDVERPISDRTESLPYPCIPPPPFKVCRVGPASRPPFLLRTSVRHYRSIEHAIRRDGRSDRSARDTQDAALGGLSYERPIIRSAANDGSLSTAGGRQFQGAKSCLYPCSSPVRMVSEDRTTGRPTPGHRSRRRSGCSWIARSRAVPSAEYCEAGRLDAELGGSKRERYWYAPPKSHTPRSA